VKVEKYQENGKFEKEVCEKDEGKYSVTYTSNTGKEGKAWVKIFIEKRLKPDNEESIQQINKDLDAKNQLLSEYNHAIGSTTENLKNVISLIETNENTDNMGKAAIENQKNDLENFIRVTNARIKELERDKEEKIKQRNEAWMYLNEKEKLARAIHKIVSGGLYYHQSDLVDHFKLRYKEYLDLCAGSSSPSSASFGIHPAFSDKEKSDSLPKEEIFILESLLCPISQEILQDPVITKCKHVFSLDNLLNALTVKRACPICRTPLKNNDYKPAPSAIVQAIEEYKQKQQEMSQNLTDMMVSQFGLNGFEKASLTVQAEKINKLLSTITKLSKELSIMNILYDQLLKAHDKAREAIISHIQSEKEDS